MDQDATTHLNQQQLPLLRLPAELRNKILSFAICGHLIHTIDVGEADPSFHVYQIRNGDWKPYNLRLNILSNGSLLRLCPASFNAVCRQLRCETSSLYWTNTLCGSPHELRSFLRHMRSQAHHIRAIETIPNGYVLCPDRYQPVVSSLNFELAGILQRLRGLRGLERVVARLGLSDSREEECVGRVGMLCRHALKWVEVGWGKTGAGG
ncbi:hypothetical protein E8E11_010707 [Didymella keratinophila]|nr:hypothetical protein E8E11_010707 [Didymella keratinophila]